MSDYPTPPTSSDLFMNVVNGRVTIRETVDHPTSGDTVGYVLPNVDGEWSWTTDAPKDWDGIDQWSTADTLQQASEELLHAHLVEWQHEYDRATEWDAYNQRPTYGRGHAA